MKSLFTKLFIGLLVPVCLAGCESVGVSMPSGSSVFSENNTFATASSQNENQNSTTLVVFFSATNNTRRVANAIANYMESSIFELEPIEPYSSADLDWTNQNSRAVKEHNDGNRHVELKNVFFEGFDKAEYVFLGAPVWWQELSWVVDDFVKMNDFSKKTIIPFATSSSSGYSTNRLQTYADGATWVTPQRFPSSASETSILSWLDSLDLSINSIS